MLLLNNTRAAQTDDTSRSHSSSEATHHTLIAASNMPQYVQYTSQSDVTQRVFTAVPARRMGIFFWSFTKMNCTTSAVCGTQTRGWIKNKLKKRKTFFFLTLRMCVDFCVSGTLWSTCAAVSFSSPLWTCDVLGWVNVVSSSSSWARKVPDCLYMEKNNDETIF